MDTKTLYNFWGRAHRVHISSRPALPSSNKSVMWLKLDTMKTYEFISWRKPRLSGTVYRSRMVPGPYLGVMSFPDFLVFYGFYENLGFHNKSSLLSSEGARGGVVGVCGGGFDPRKSILSVPGPGNGVNGSKNRFFGILRVDVLWDFRVSRDRVLLLCPLVRESTVVAEVV